MMTQMKKMITNFFISVEPFEVHKIAFEFEDKPGLYKKRPVIVIASKQFSSVTLVLSVKVTSHAARKDYPGEIELLDWKEAGLQKPSTARCSKLARVPIDQFTEKTLYGRLSHRDSRRIYEALLNIGVLKEL